MFRRNVFPPSLRSKSKQMKHGGSSKQTGGWRAYVLPKRRCASTGLHGVIPQGPIPFRIKDILTCTAVAMQWLRDRWIRTQQWSYFWKWCFLLGPCRGVMRKTIGVTEWVESWVLQGRLRIDGSVVQFWDIRRTVTTWAQKLKNLHC
jgi:hypothetical protein